MLTAMMWFFVEILLSRSLVCIFQKYFMARQNKIYSCFLITQNLSLFDYSLSAEYSNWPREFEMLLPVSRLKRLEFRLKLKPSYFILLSLLKGNLFASFTRWSRNKFPGATCSDKLKFPSCFIFLKASPRFRHFLIHAPFYLLKNVISKGVFLHNSS